MQTKDVFRLASIGIPPAEQSMNPCVLLNLLLVGLLVITNGASAQPAKRRPVVVPPDDLLTVKRKADAGDAKAQVVLGNRLFENQRCADALIWYRKASAKGSAEADYHVGTMLLHGADTGVANQDVLPNPAEGIQATYRAATNFHAKACRDMSLALQKGLGVEPNRIEAYAWLQLFAERVPAGRGHEELDSLALKMETRDLEEGQKLAKQFNKRHWPKLSVIKSPKVSVPLILDGVTAGGKTPLAVINRRTIAVGETASIPVNGRSFDVKCLAIGEDSVQIEVEGEFEPRWLRFDSRLATRSVGP